MNNNKTCRRGRECRGTIKIGMTTDPSGTCSDVGGKGGAHAVRMARADLGGAIDGKKSAGGKIEFVDTPAASTRIDGAVE